VRIRTIILSGLTSAASLLILLLIFQFSLSSAEASQLESSNAGWIDQFDSPTLDSRWEWIREDPTHWSLTERPGFLRITTQDGLPTDNTAENILLTNPTLENYKITTKVDFSPTENVQNALLIIYQDYDNFFMLRRRYANGDEVSILHKFGEGVNYVTSTLSSAETYLRITKYGDRHIGSYSLDGNTWIDMGQFNARFTDPKVGLMTYQYAPTSTIPAEIPADFDYFQLSEVGTTLYVAPDGKCGEASPCYATIQEAVDTAESFDTIKVAAGTYDDLNVRPRDDITTTGQVSQVVYLTKSVFLQGGYSSMDWSTPNPQANPTTLDAQGQGRVIYIAGDINPSIQGFTVTGGDAAGLGGDRIEGTMSVGGGIYIWKSLARLENNIIQDNSAESGGGIFVDGPDWGSPDDPGAIIMGNDIISNTATAWGGGIHISASAASVVRNVIRDNTADFGGGVHEWLSSPQLEQNLIINNTASQGGGILFHWGDPTLTNNVIADNHAESHWQAFGTGLHNDGANLTMSHNTIARNTSSNDQGSGFYIVDDLVWGQPTINMTNTILVDQPLGIFANGVSTLTVNGVLWYNTPVTITTSPTAVLSVNNEYWGDPLFADDGYHLTAGSAAIDKGVDAGVTVDIDGEPRPSDTGFDLGADELELWITVYLPMITNK
jgi:hypothetical protein